MSRIASRNAVIRTRSGPVRPGETGIEVRKVSDNTLAAVYANRTGGSDIGQSGLTTDQNGYLVGPGGAVVYFDPDDYTLDSDHADEPLELDWGSLAASAVTSVNGEVGDVSGLVAGADATLAAVTAGRVAGGAAIQSKILVLPEAGSTKNAITVQAPDANWNDDTDPEYGTQQAFVLFKSGTGDAGDQILFRIDGHTGAIGNAGGAHFAVGLNLPDAVAGGTALWIQEYVDGYGIIVQAASDAPAYPYLICESLSGNLAFQVGKNGTIEGYAPSTASTAQLILGRTPSAQEGILGVAPGTSWNGVTVASGDVIVEERVAGKTLRLLGTAVRAHTANHSIQPSSAGNVTASAFSGAAGNWAAMQIGRTTGELQLVIAAATNQFTTGTAAGDGVIKHLTAGAQLWIGVGTDAQEIRIQDAKLGFFNTAPVARPTVTGSRGGNAAMASTLTALASLGLLIDNSTA